MKKFLYLLIVFFLGVFVAYTGYSSNKYEHISNMVHEAIDEKDYEEIAKIFGGCCDTAPLYSEKNDKLDLVIYNGTSMLDLSYGEQRSYTYEETYYLYLFDVKYEFNTFDGTDNKSSIIFYGEDDKTYTYPLVVTDTINKEYYSEEIKTKDGAILNSARNVVANYDIWRFMYVNITKSMIDTICREMGSDSIIGLSITDNKGVNVINVDENLNFCQKFFIDMSELIGEYNKYLTAYLKDENASEAEKEFNEFYEKWQEDFEANKEETGYTFPYDQNYLVPKKILWKTVGQITIYTTIVFCFYILFFHYSFVKGVFGRIFGSSKKKNKGPIIVKKEELVIVEQMKENNDETISENEEIKDASV